MVVKNEGGRIIKCLQSVKPFIDYWVIVDVGSEDGTQKIIRDYLKDVPGELYEMAWRGTEETHNTAISLAAKQADYIFLMSGEDYLERDASFHLPALDQDVYCISTIHQKKKALHRQLLKSSIPWHWKSGLYEYVFCDEPCVSAVLEGIRCISGAHIDSEEDIFGSAQDSKKKEQNQEECQKALSFANGYLEAQDNERALEWFTRHCLLAQDRREAFVSLVRIANLQEELSYPNDVVLNSYYRAYRSCPQRFEAVYYLVRFYNRQEKYDLANDCIQARNYLPQESKEAIPEIHNWREKYGLLFEHSVCLYHLGKYQESLNASNDLLKKDILPAAVRRQVVANRNFALQKLVPKK